MLRTLVESGRIVDLILGLVAIEVVAVALWTRGRSRGYGAVEALLNALQGAGLLLALRAALTGAQWTAVAGWLGGALLAHILDVRRRWNRTDDRASGAGPSAGPASAMRR